MFDNHFSYDLSLKYIGGYPALSFRIPSRIFHLTKYWHYKISAGVRARENDEKSTHFESHYKNTQCFCSTIKRVNHGKLKFGLGKGNARALVFNDTLYSLDAFGIT